MPTGYTHNIKDDITFEQFAMQCSRAMGALIDMRDAPSDEPIPDEPSIDTSYYDEGLIKDRVRLAEINAMSTEGVARAAKEHYNKEIQDNIRRIKERGELRNKYQHMLLNVLAWIPPTPEHDNFKKFMTEQLESSIDFDCNTSYYDDKKVELETGEAWRLRQVEYLNGDIEYKLKERVKSIDRANKNHKWVVDLRNSL
jgi:hypothetical protein